MRDRIRRVLAIAVALLGLLGCNWAASIDNQRLATSVAGTLAAAGPISTGTPPSSATDGGATGKVCYPASSVSGMTAYIQEVPSGSLVTFPIAPGQSSYSTELPAGRYIAYAWTDGYGQGGSYSQAVSCGLGPTCTDHSPLPFEVAAGATTQGIDLCDWPAQNVDVPYPPGVTPAAPMTPEASGGVTATPLPPDAAPGAIVGTLSFPGGSTPRLIIVAFQRNTDRWWYIVTGENWTSYEIADIPPGEYQVIAYAADGREAAYPSGTEPQVVIVQPGAMTSGIDLSDWRPAGTFRPKPASARFP